LTWSRPGQLHFFNPLKKELRERITEGLFSLPKNTAIV
jgi:hypothetical protein